MLDRMEDVFQKNGYGDDFGQLETFVEEIVEGGTMWPGVKLTVTHSLSLRERLRGKHTVPVDGWFSMGVMIGTALERDVPIDSDVEELYRDGELSLPETAVPNSDKERRTEDSHPWNTMRDGPKGPVLCHFCEGTRAKLGAAEDCNDCSLDSEDDRDV
jgi:hypothetical protein